MSDSGQTINKKVILSPSFLLRKELFILEKSNRFESEVILVELMSRGTMYSLRPHVYIKKDKQELEGIIETIYDESITLEDECTLIITYDHKFISVHLINLKTCDELKEEIDKNLFRIGLGFN